MLLELRASAPGCASTVSKSLLKFNASGAQRIGFGMGVCGKQILVHWYWASTIDYIEKFKLESPQG